MENIFRGIFVTYFGYNNLPGHTDIRYINWYVLFDTNKMLICNYIMPKYKTFLKNTYCRKPSKQPLKKKHTGAL